MIVRCVSQHYLQRVLMLVTRRAWLHDHFDRTLYDAMRAKIVCVDPAFAVV